jgi:general secretion pathway protein G
LIFGIRDQDLDGNLTTRARPTFGGWRALSLACLKRRGDATDDADMRSEGFDPADGGGDRGFTLIEMLIVIVVLGILATVVIVSVQGITNRGEDATCDADVHTLSNAAEAYFAKHGGDSIPLDGVGSDAVERTLANAGLLREPSDLYDMDSDGAVLVSASSRCTTV